MAQLYKNKIIKSWLKWLFLNIYFFYLIWPWGNLKRTVTRTQLWTECLCPLKIHIWITKFSMQWYLEVGLVFHEWINDPIRRAVRRMISFFSALRMQWGDSHLLTRKQVCTRTPPWWNSDVEFPFSRTVRNKCVLFQTLRPWHIFTAAQTDWDRNCIVI